ncbi:RraA family protein [Gorillibacterium sp. CAU 1737]|uniref:RraA family protein n=1 Tax=Gorillibacterium sp. CAU 1737 TaxID=3140362 RepID=UPI003260642A
MFDRKEDILKWTEKWNGERFENGRPKVSDDLLDRVKRITLEEAWGPLWNNGYRFQFEGGFKIVHPNEVMVGRAVTAVMVPTRPDLHETLVAVGASEGRKGFYNQWVIDVLQDRDVAVVDMFDKVHLGTYVGGNLSTAIAARTGSGGAVIWGGIRDNSQVEQIDGINVYYRGSDPTAIADVVMTGMNVPCRIGAAVCLPGDIVFGTPNGVIFIPPHLAEQAVIEAEKSQVRDIFGFIRLRSGTYSTAQIDSPWTVEIWDDFMAWFQQEEQAKLYRHLIWEHELEEARNRGDEGLPQVRA